MQVLKTDDSDKCDPAAFGVCNEHGQTLEECEKDKREEKD